MHKKPRRTRRTSSGYIWCLDFNQQVTERRRYLNQTYPRKLINQLELSELQRIGYVLGLGMTDNKKEYVDKILRLQKDENPIIQLSDDGKYQWNTRCMLMEYLLIAQ